MTVYICYSYCCDKVREILPQLVPEDISDGVLAVCHKIAQRLAGEKIQVWMNTHITTGINLIMSHENLF